MAKRIMRAFKINEISAVDRPAQAHAKVVLMKRDFSASERRHDAGTGAAMPDGSFPIENAEDLANARRLAGKAKDPAAARAHIARRAKALGLSKLDGLIEEYLGQEDTTMIDITLDKQDLQKAVDAAVVEIRKEFEDKHKDMVAKLAKAESDLVKANMTEDERAYYDKADGKEKDDFAGMSPEDRKKKMKKVADDAIPESVRKQLADAEDLRKRLSILEEGEEIAKFAKKAVVLGLEEVHGEILRKAFAGEKEAIGKLEGLLKGLAEQVRTGKIFAEFGSNQPGAGSTAADEMNAQAAVYRDSQIKIGKNISLQQAFSHVYTDPAFVELKKRYDAEEIKKRRAA